MHENGFANPGWHERTPHLRRRVLRTLLLDVCAFAALVVAGELAVRAWVPDCRRFLYGVSVTAGHSIVLNADDLRDREFPRQRPPGETRILCLGDSVTFGSGVAGEQAWPRQLEAELRAAGGGGRVFVINAAGQGFSLGESIDRLREGWLAYEPSLVVLGFSTSMVSRADRRRVPAPVAAPAAPAAASSPLQTAAASVRLAGRRAFEFVHSSSCLYTLSAAAYRRVLYRLQIRRQPVDQGGLAAYAFDAPGVDRERIERGYASCQRLLAELKALLDERGIPLVVVSVPARFELSGAACDNEFVLDLEAIRIRPGARIAEICRELHVPCIDLLPVLEARRRDMLSGRTAWDDLYVELDYTHLNRAGSRIAARAVCGALLEDPQLAAWRRGRLPAVAAEAEASRRLR